MCENTEIIYKVIQMQNAHNMQKTMLENKGNIFRWSIRVSRKWVKENYREKNYISIAILDYTYSQTINVQSTHILKRSMYGPNLWHVSRLGALPFYFSSVKMNVMSLLAGCSPFPSMLPLSTDPTFLCCLCTQFISEQLVTFKTEFFLI